MAISTDSSACTCSMQLSAGQANTLTMPSTAIIITDDCYEVKFLSERVADDANFREIIFEQRLSSALQDLLRRSGISVRNLAVPRAVALNEQTVVHCSRLVGAGTSLIMLAFEANRDVDALNRAAMKFSLTRRETAVLALVLEGAKARQIAEALMISEHTVHGYMKRLIAKTNARNRAAMVALVLEWDRSHQPYRQFTRGNFQEDAPASALAL